LRALASSRPTSLKLVYGMRPCPSCYEDMSAV
jgi:hypothetical protein